MVERLLERYRKEVVPRLRERFRYANAMQVPRLVKVTINIGVGDAREEEKRLEAAVEELASISGQRPVVTRARASIANFKIRKGMKVGCFVTLRGRRMWAFLDKLMAIALPRVRDFRGLSPRGFDGRGNFNLGVREQLIFPEIDYDKVKRVRGMNITIATTARTNEEGRELLSELGMPFRKG